MRYLLTSRRVQKQVQYLRKDGWHVIYNHERPGRVKTMEKDEKDKARKPLQNALKYGGEGAVRRISEGKPFIGLAAEEEKAVTADLAAAGISDLTRRDAIRLQTALNLYWNAVMKAAADGDLAAFDRFIARFGWLSGVTLRALAQVAQNEQAAAKRGAGIVDVLQAMKGGENG